MQMRGEVVKVTIPGELPDLNKIINTAKTHWSQYRAMKESNTDLVAWCAKGQEKIDRADFIFTWYAKDRRTDPDNLAAGQKFILDGLVKAGVLAGDGWKQVRSIYHRFEVDRERPRVEIEIREVK